MGQRTRALDAQDNGLRVSLPNGLRELTVFGAEAQHLFCESFHVAVKFKRKSRKLIAFPAGAGVPAAAERPLGPSFFQRPFSAVITVRPLPMKAPSKVSPRPARIVAAVLRRSEKAGVRRTYRRAVA